MLSVVCSVGSDASLLSPEDYLCYAGAINRAGDNRDPEVADEHIARQMPAMRLAWRRQRQPCH